MNFLQIKPNIPPVIAALELYFFGIFEAFGEGGLEGGGEAAQQKHFGLGMFFLLSLKAQRTRRS